MTRERSLLQEGIERMAHYYSAFVAARDAHAPRMPVYLEEMATQAGGGCDGLSNRFVSGFWFVHALGLAGEMNVSRVTRQDLAGEEEALSGPALVPHSTERPPVLLCRLELYIRR